MKEVLRQTAEFEGKATDTLSKDLDDPEPSAVRELEEVSIQGIPETQGRSDKEDRLALDLSGKIKITSVKVS